MGTRRLRRLLRLRLLAPRSLVMVMNPRPMAGGREVIVRALAMVKTGERSASATNEVDGGAIGRATDLGTDRAIDRATEGITADAIVIEVVTTGAGTMSVSATTGVAVSVAVVVAVAAPPPGAPDHARQVVDRAPAHHPGTVAAHHRPRGGAAVRALGLGREVGVGQRLRTTSRP